MEGTLSYISSYIFINVEVYHFDFPHKFFPIKELSPCVVLFFDKITSSYNSFVYIFNNPSPHITHLHLV